ncbi:unnamed protein product [Brassica rapa subsp. trilocularis]
MDETGLQGDDHDGGVEKVRAPVYWKMTTSSELS